MHFCGCTLDVLFFTDGKPWKMARPSRGDAADALVRAAGGNDINLVQQSILQWSLWICRGKSAVCAESRWNLLFIHMLIMSA